MGEGRTSGQWLREGAVRRFLSLRSEDRRRFLVALPLVLAVRVGLWSSSFKRVRAVVARFARRRPGAQDPTPGEAERIAWAVRSAARFVPAASCLTQAIAAEVLLTRAGHPAEIRLGVSRDNRGEIEAHAWVESYGRVILGDEDLERYSSLEHTTPAGLNNPTLG